MTDHNPSVREDARALIVFGSTHGHTAKIAARMADAIREQGLRVDVLDVEHARGADPDRYDVTVVGASLHKVKHQKEVAEWVVAHRAALESHPSVFFSVSLSAAEDTPESRAATQVAIEEFCTQTGWRPTCTERIAGCLQYREYDPFTRQLMRLLMRKMGHPTDASQDYDYTDWEGVDVIGREIAELASVHPAAA